MFSTKKISDQDLGGLRSLVGRAILFVTFTVNVLSTIGILFTVHRLGLLSGSPALKLDQNGEAIVFNQDIIADTLILQDSLQTRTIEGNQINITSSDSNGWKGEIVLDNEKISIEADMFNGKEGNNRFPLQFPKRLGSLQVDSGAENLKAIRSPASKTSATLNGVDNQLGNLHIKSNGNLELSGNMGLRVHSRDLSMKSHEPMMFRSKEGSIYISTGEGLFLPDLQHEQDHHIDNELANRIQSSTDEDDYSVGRHQLCIDRRSGLLYRANSHC